MASKRYQKLNPREHALQVPTTHIGKVDKHKTSDYIIEKNEDNTFSVSKQEITYVPGAFKCVEEVLSNALDVYIRSKTYEGYEPMKNIWVQVDRSNSIITCTNDGEPIQIYKDDTHNEYTPELVFSNLMSGESFTEERETSGSVGEGASLTNTFSEWFYVEVMDHHSSQLYTQIFRKNNSERDQPRIVKKQRKSGYVKVSFKLDFKRFGLDGIDTTFENLIYHRTVQLSALTDQSVSVHYNGERIKFKTFEAYASLFTKGRDNSKHFHKVLDDSGKWEIVVSHSSEENAPETISFVNGTYTPEGGAHVNAIKSDFSNKFRSFIQEKHKNMDVKPKEIENNMLLFVKATVKNPHFDSNTKNKLLGGNYTPPKIPKDFVQRAYDKLEIKQRIIDSHKNVKPKSTSENDGQKISRITGIPDLEDANNAGKSQLGKDGKPLSSHCTLFVTEGNSAKQLVLSGMSIIGKDWYGVLPLSGKITNPSSGNVNKSKEISNIKRVLGLKANTTYTDTSSLRYGHLAIFSDFDQDGSHIAALLMQYFYYEHKSLLKIPGFMYRMITPIVKARKYSKDKKDKIIDEKEFYSDRDFKEWHSSSKKAKGYKIEYLKGLASSTSQDAKGYFQNINDNLITITFNDKDDAKALDLALGKRGGKLSTDPRKDWLREYDENDKLEYKSKDVSINEFIHRDLKHFSAYDVERSIPCFIDGLKLSQRKILYTALKLWTSQNADVQKVSQFASNVSLRTNYAHGETSLQEAIAKMTQSFIGAYAIPYLEARGQTGSRDKRGKDHGAARYIKTRTEPHTWTIFRRSDEPVLTYREEEGDVIEPYTYYPIIPTVLINSSDGIGTGFSTNIPPFNPDDLIKNLRMIINNEVQSASELPELVPWYRRFSGTIEKRDRSTFIMYGVWEKMNQRNWITVKELPVDVSFSDFKEHLENLIQKKIVVQYNNHTKDDRPNFKIQFKDLSSIDDVSKTLKLLSTIRTNNMHLLDENLRVSAYSSPNDILWAYYEKRLEKYYERKALRIEELQNEIKFLNAKADFILRVISNEIDIRNTPQSSIVQMLKDKDFPKAKDNDDDTYQGFGYLLNMRLNTLTKEKKDELLKQKGDREKELETYKNTSPETIWLNEISEFENIWNDLEK